MTSYDQLCKLSLETKTDFSWWMNKVEQCNEKRIMLITPDMTLTLDVLR